MIKQRDPLDSLFFKEDELRLVDPERWNKLISILANHRAEIRLLQQELSDLKRTVSDKQ